ncbi:MAG TPA: aspartate-semialdehyde dehydrogenase [Candidatus Latescibacteria bacterium]|nr:aspartate-semialdehyde dehydrogenase [Candidatus Latescibacterota bacterium]
MENYRVGVIGVGLVGTEIIKLLRGRNFPAQEIKVLARSARDEEIAGKIYKVEPASIESFDGIDIAFFAGTEGAKGASQLYGWAAVERGTTVIDNGDDYRMDPRVPLVIPEVNPHHLRMHQGFVSNPNCSTIQMVLVLAPLHREVKIKRVVVSTYQAVSGTGRAAVGELERQARNVLDGGEPKPDVYPHRIAFNLIPQIGNLKDEMPGYYSEEVKMVRETRKILDEPDLAISATCVRVPVFNGHSESINIQFERKLTADEARQILQEAEGVEVVDDPSASRYPTPLYASGKDMVYVGRIREDPSTENCLDLFVVSDNIRKGAALNAVQIAEKMIEMELV